jgi:hypothetical protein
MRRRFRKPTQGGILNGGRAGGKADDRTSSRGETSSSGVGRDRGLMRRVSVEADGQTSWEGGGRGGYG